MASEIQSIGTTGKTVYAIVRDATGRLWNVATSAFEAWTTANYANYAVPMVEQVPSAYYVGSFPVLVTTPGLYGIDVRQQVGATPATTDTPLSGGLLNWAGTAEATVAAVQARVTTALPAVAAGAAGGLPTATNGSGQVTASSVVGAVGSVTAAVTTDVDAPVAAIRSVLPTTAAPGTVGGLITAPNVANSVLLDTANIMIDGTVSLQKKWRAELAVAAGVYSATWGTGAGTVSYANQGGTTELAVNMTLDAQGRPTARAITTFN